MKLYKIINSPNYIDAEKTRKPLSGKYQENNMNQNIQTTSLSANNWESGILKNSIKSRKYNNIFLYFIAQVFRKKITSKFMTFFFLY